VTATATATAAPMGPRPYGSTPLIIAGIGGALAIAGAIMFPVGMGQYNDAREKLIKAGCNPSKACFDVEDVNRGNTGLAIWYAGGVFLGVGLVAAVGGVGFHFLFNKPTVASGATAPATKAGLDILPVVSPHTGGLMVTGRF